MSIPAKIPRVLHAKNDRIPPDAIYCARRVRGDPRWKRSPFANPFLIGRDGTRDEVVAKYEAWLPTQPELMALVPTLAGYDLVCWCAPLRCHCDMLLRLANRTGTPPP